MCVENRNKGQGSRASKMFFSNTLSFSIGFMKELVAIYSLTENRFQEKGNISLQH